MREIKFRCFDPETGKLTKGATIKDTCLKARVTDFYWDDNLILSQFTGLLDKNGKEIYEGDIITCYDNAAFESPDMGKYHTGIIEFHPPQFTLNVPGKLIYDGGAVKQWANNICLNDWDNAENIEVIGNIYENPELLK